jgi:hypothetical protein
MPESSQEHAEYRVARQAIYERVHELNKRLDIVASDATPKLSDVPRLCRELMSRLSIRSATNSLRNHIFFIWVYFSVPMSLFSAALTYQDAPLTLIRILWIPLRVHMCGRYLGLRWMVCDCPLHSSTVYAEVSLRILRDSCRSRRAAVGPERTHASSVLARRVQTGHFGTFLHCDSAPKSGRSRRLH